MDEALHLLTRAFVRRGGALGEQVHPAVHVGVVVEVVAGDRVDHGARLLRRRGVVEIHERLAVDFLVEDGKVLPHPLDVHGALRHLADSAQWTDAHATSFHPSNPGSREPTSSRTRACRGRKGIRFTISLAKA